MRNKQILVVLLLVGVLFSSCGIRKNQSFNNNKARGEAGVVRVNQFSKYQFNKKGNVIDTTGTFMWSYYDATRRGSLIYLDKKGRLRVLSENPPDAAIQSITNITGSFKKGDKIDTNLGVETSKSIAELGKRTAAVNMMRDALYRLNELYYATRDEYNDNVKLFLNKTESFNKSGINNAQELKSLSSIQNIDKLFEKVITNAKEIAIQEAKADIEKSKADIPKYKAEKAKYEKERLALIKTITEQLKDLLTKEQLADFLSKLPTN